MPDPAGYSIPIVNRDEFAKHFLHAANDKLKPKEDRKSEFDTENGGLRYAVMSFSAPVHLISNIS